MAPFKDLASTTPSLVVYTPEDGDDFLASISSRAFNAHCLREGLLPDAVVQANSTAGVQAAVKFCATNGLKICVRSGGHSWDSSWLQGSGTVILDIGDLNSIDIKEGEGGLVVEAGPGAAGLDILKALPESVMFPCGHCPGVPIGGFILGGGYGLGFQRYGLTTMLVDGVEVVGGDGQVYTAEESSADEKQAAVMRLIKGSYSGFPGVITKYKFANLPPRVPLVLNGMIVFDMKDWKKAAKLALDIQFRGDEDVAAIETTGVFTYAPPPLAEATGVQMVAMVGLLVFADDEDTGLELWKKYTDGVEGTLVPIEEPQPIPIEAIPSMFGAFYPEGMRYKSDQHVAGDSIRSLSNEEIIEFLQPVADVYLSDDKPPPGSHTLYTPIHSNLENVPSHAGKHFTTGNTPSLAVMTYMIYPDAALDEAMESIITKAHAPMASSPHFLLGLPEGAVRKRAEAQTSFTESAWKSTSDSIKLLDPSGVFAGFQS